VCVEQGEMRQAGEAAAPADSLDLLQHQRLTLAALTPETITVRWVPAAEVVTLPLHPGFAATWPLVRTLL
jgi:hypothetical protein